MLAGDSPACLPPNSSLAKKFRTKLIAYGVGFKNVGYHLPLIYHFILIIYLYFYIKNFRNQCIQCVRQITIYYVLFATDIFLITSTSAVIFFSHYHSPLSVRLVPLAYSTGQILSLESYLITEVQASLQYYANSTFNKKFQLR